MVSIALQAVFLVGSNIFFLLPSLKAYGREMLFEGTVFLVMGIVSAIYHIVDTIPNVNIIFSYSTLQFDDFYLAFNLIPVATLMIMFSTDKDEPHESRVRNFKIKSVLWMILGVVSVTLVKQNVNIYQMVFALGGLCLIVGAISFIFWRNSIYLDIADFIAMWIFIISGAFCFFFDEDDYWILHSCWHVCAAIGMFFGVESESGHKAWNIINFLTCKRFCNVQLPVPPARIC